MILFFTDVTKQKIHQSLTGIDISQPLTFTSSQRGKPILWFMGYRFRREREMTEGRVYWRCLRAKCRGRMIVKMGLIVKYHIHNHEADDVIRK